MVKTTKEPVRTHANIAIPRDLYDLMRGVAEKKAAEAGVRKVPLNVLFEAAIREYAQSILGK